MVYATRKEKKEFLLGTYLIFNYLCTHIFTKVEEKKFNILNNIKDPIDLRKLTVDELPQLCNELREDIVQELSVNPGHLASSLGVVEM